MFRRRTSLLPCCCCCYCCDDELMLYVRQQTCSFLDLLACLRFAAPLRRQARCAKQLGTKFMKRLLVSMPTIMVGSSLLQSWYWRFRMRPSLDILAFPPPPNASCKPRLKAKSKWLSSLVSLSVVFFSISVVFLHRVFTCGPTCTFPHSSSSSCTLLCPSSLHCFWQRLLTSIKDIAPTHMLCLWFSSLVAILTPPSLFFLSVAISPLGLRPATLLSHLLLCLTTTTLLHSSPTPLAPPIPPALLLPHLPPPPPHPHPLRPPLLLLAPPPPPPPPH